MTNIKQSQITLKKGGAYGHQNIIKVGKVDTHQIENPTLTIKYVYLRRTDYHS